jgi:hypothetical protein
MFLVKSAEIGLEPLVFTLCIAYAATKSTDMPEHLNQIAEDPVLSTFDLPLRRLFYPLGYPLAVETNSHDVIHAAEQGWGSFKPSFEAEPVRVYLGVSESDSRTPLPASVLRAREHLMSIIADPENFMQCDLDRGFAFGWVTRNTAKDHSLLRYRFLTAGGFSLVQQRAFAPVHGALVMRNGTGVLLCGDSFAGKSTLAYACARAGWTYLSDDGSFLVRDRADRYMLGDPNSIRFRPDAPELFPELADYLPVVRPNGKIAIEVSTRDLGVATGRGCVVDHVVFLDRAVTGAASVASCAKERLREYCAHHAVLGTAAMRSAQKSCYERLLGARVWKMRYSDLDDAVACMELLVDQGN